MRIGARAAFAAAVAVALTAGGPAALAQAKSGHDDDHGHGGHGAKATKVFTLEASATAANPEGVAWDKRTEAFFTGGTGDGTIFRGTLDDPTVHVFIPGTTGASAVGMKVSHGKLYVAGGGTGTIKVYDIATKALLATFNTGAGGFLNDLVVTEDGDVWVTDSFRSKIWLVTAEQVKAGGTVALAPTQAIDLSAAIPAAAGVFALNGIVTRHDGDKLIAIQSNTGTLWSLDADIDDPDAEMIGVEPVGANTAPLTGGDGMIIDKGRLLVVIGDPASVAVVKLRHHHSEARVENVVTDATLHGPSTIARAENTYLVVNANFGGTPPFTLSGLDRRAVKHGGHGGHGGHGHHGGSHH